MTIGEEGKALRAEVLKLRPDKRRRYSDDLKRRILAWVDRSVAVGETESDCGHTLGLKTWRFRMWRELHARKEVLALVPIDTHGAEQLFGARPILITPTGYRIEGLAVMELAKLLRELA